MLQNVIKMFCWLAILDLDRIHHGPRTYNGENLARTHDFCRSANLAFHCIGLPFYVPLKGGRLVSSDVLNIAEPIG